MYVRISHTHRPGDPRFPGNPANQVIPILSLARGQTCNAAEVRIFNHNGTHVDCPNHYIAAGRPLSDYDVSDFVFHRPRLVEVAVAQGGALTQDLLAPFARDIAEADLLLLKTGAGAQRRTPAYLDNPYLTVDAAEYLRTFADLRAVGVDAISVTNPRFQALGDDVHRTLLGERAGRRPLFIVEDLDLRASDVIRRFQRVFIIPLFVEGVDSMPCTVFGEYEG